MLLSLVFSVTQNETLPGTIQDMLVKVGSAYASLQVGLLFFPYHLIGVVIDTFPNEAMIASVNSIQAFGDGIFSNIIPSTVTEFKLAMRWSIYLLLWVIFILWLVRRLFTHR